MTFTAQYQESGSVTPPAEEKIIVEFGAGADGKFADDQVTKYEISKGGAAGRSAGRYAEQQIQLCRLEGAERHQNVHRSADPCDEV